VGLGGGTEYRERLHDICASTADDWTSSYSEEAKDWPLFGVCAWVFVSSFRPSDFFPADAFMLTGQSICVVSILRLPVLIVAAKSKDPTGDNPAVAKWSIVELNVAIICSSLTTLRPLILRWFPTIFGSLDGHGQGGHSYDMMPPTIGSASTPGHGAIHGDSLLRSGNGLGTRQCESADRASSTVPGGVTKEQSVGGQGAAVSIVVNEV